MVELLPCKERSKKRSRKRRQKRKEEYTYVRHEVDIVRLAPPRHFHRFGEPPDIADVNASEVAQTLFDHRQELPATSKVATKVNSKVGSKVASKVTGKVASKVTSKRASKRLQ